MKAVTRRGFVQSAGAAAGAGLLAPFSSASAVAWSPCGADVSADTVAGATADLDRSVRLGGDGIAISPRAYATLLDELCRQADVAEDNYLLGGEVERFEQHWAGLLGKERAVFMPSGTLANQLALRALAGDKRRVVVPEMSHIYNDTGDACQTLSNLTLLPLAAGAATFTRADVEAVVTRTAGGRVATEVGALAVESPIRRLFGQMFDWEEAKRVTAFARERGIGTHLDGARLFIASAYTVITPRQYAAEFDTVYVSLWKYFNSGIGSILAGPKRLLDDMFHARRMFGGNLAVGWPAALIARHFMEGFEQRFKSAVTVSEAFYTQMARHPRVTIERIPNGTNIARMTIKGADPAILRTRLREKNIFLPAPASDGVFMPTVNETWNRTTAANLAAAFDEAIG